MIAQLLNMPNVFTLSKLRTLTLHTLGEKPMTISSLDLNIRSFNSAIKEIRDTNSQTILKLTLNWLRLESR